MKLLILLHGCHNINILADAVGIDITVDEIESSVDFLMLIFQYMKLELIER